MRIEAWILSPEARGNPKPVKRLHLSESDARDGDDMLLRLTAPLSGVRGFQLRGIPPGT